MNFAITGVGGFVAPRHLQAIRDVGGKLVAALDPHDAVGVLDRLAGPDVHFFTEPDRFERHLNRNPVDWLSICSPNYVHDVQTRIGMIIGANVICEKPLALTPWNLDAMERAEQQTGKRVYTVLQLRLHSEVIALKKMLDAEPRHRDVVINYVTPRGRWYHQSWKGDIQKSGGLVTNIGIHLFDLMIFLFGSVESFELTGGRHVQPYNEPEQHMVSHGQLQLTRANVTWRLSIDPTEAPGRVIRIDGQEVNLDGGFTDLHTEVYRETLAGRGFGIETARPAVELAYRLRQA